MQSTSKGTNSRHFGDL